MLIYHRQVREDLEAPYAALLEAARCVAKAANEAKLPLDGPEYVSSFRPDLMELLSAWARGAKFADLLRITDIFEVRMMPGASDKFDMRVDEVHAQAVVTTCGGA